MLLLLLNCQNFSLKGQHFKTADFCRWCFRCARRHSVSFCPAINAQCRNCLKLHHFARASHTRLEPESRDVITPVTSVPSVTNVYHFFYEPPRRRAFRLLRLRLRHCLLWCRELSMLPRTLVFAGCFGVWCRAFRARIVYMLPRAMVPRARPNGLVVSRGAAHSYVIHGAAHWYAAAHSC